MKAVHHDDEIARLATAGDVVVAADRLFGATLEARGLIHAVAVWQGDSGRYLTLADDSGTPRSHHRTFVQSLARARADAIIISGEILRHAPGLDHRLEGPGSSPRALAEWRRERLLKRQPPVTLVITSGRDIDLDHPVFRHWTRPVVYTTRQTHWELESRAPDHGVELVGVDAPTAGSAVEFLRRAFGAATIVLEADPRICQELYAPPAVNEVLLSVCRAPRIPTGGAQQGPFLSAEQLTRRFPRHSEPYRVATEDGEWSFQRFRR